MITHMHELAIAQSVVDIASRHAAGRPVNKVNLKIGHLRQVVPTALRFSFGLVAEGTPLEGAELEIDHVPAVGLCNDCGVESTLPDFPFHCAACSGFNLEILEGNELIVESIEIEEAEVGSYSY
jgi:hydrogenase nickel incorporation protein HypA/HybF